MKNIVKIIIYSLYFIILSFSDHLRAAEESLTIKVIPEEPAHNESFIVEFHLETELDGEPVVSFNPSNLQVIGETGKRMSSSSSYINGKWSTSQKIILGYELKASRPGRFFINDIKVELNGNIFKHKMIGITVLDAPRKAQDVMCIAEVSKKDVFLNESIIVKYYIYTKVPIRTPEILKFPTFNSFIKRMHDVRDQEETVDLNGEIYTRFAIYILQVFPQKSGELEIEPIHLKVPVVSRRNDPFGFGIGMGMNQMSTRTIMSAPVKIKVMDPPAQNVPASFKGLIGKHQFSLSLNKNKFLINEPIEIKINISGDGALEKVDLNNILTDDFLEEFEVNSDLQVQTNFQATKIFNITYLGRKNAIRPTSPLEFSYFDPKANAYEKVLINIPEIQIEGGVANQPTQDMSPDSSQISGEDNDMDNSLLPKLSESNPNPNPNSNQDFILSPSGSQTSWRDYLNFKLLNIVLGLFWLMLMFWLFKQRWKNSNTISIGITREFKKVITYQRLLELFSPLAQKYHQPNLNLLIKVLPMTDSAKDYFLGIIFQAEQAYLNNTNFQITVHNKDFLLELEKCFKDINNENDPSKKDNDYLGRITGAS